MRIIAGTLGGLQFDSPKGNRAHPMGDRVRTGLFNTLGDIEGLTVLDGFSGSGALSFEAISRGAKQATAIEIDKTLQTKILENIRVLGLSKSKIKVIRANASSWSDKNPDANFDIVMLDPPYNDIKPNLLDKITNHTKIGGVTVISLPPSSDYRPPANDYQLLANKSYGDAKLVFYRKTA